MDEIDMAQEKEEIGLAHAIRVASMARPAVVATGMCLWCDEIVGDNVRWCSVPCRDAWQSAANGGRR